MGRLAKRRSNKMPMYRKRDIEALATLAMEASKSFGIPECILYPTPESKAKFKKDLINYIPACLSYTMRG